jgi:hypothetical protein
VLSLPSEFSKTATFGLIETLNQDVNKAVFGEVNVVPTAEGFAVAEGSTVPPQRSVVIDEIIQGGFKRTYFPIATLQITEDITESDEDPVSFGVTLTAQADANGKTDYVYYAIQGTSDLINVNVTADNTEAVELQYTTTTQTTPTPVPADGNVPVDKGDDITVTPTLDGVTIVEWVQDGVHTGTSTPARTISKVTVAHTLKLITQTA